ncbi:MAG: uroporphyrinogen-III synthase, partial [Gammaproteobacteria bacterium]
MNDESPQTAGSPTVALPETRQLDLLERLLTSRNVAVVRCPMIAIRDAADPEPVVSWIARLIDSAQDLLVFYTGEGVYRLQGFAERAGIYSAFVDALGSTPLLTRGPKPVRALRALGIRPSWEAKSPTTEGVIASLDELPLEGRRVGVQLYGTDPNETLMSYLRTRHAEPDCVAPYVYASESDDAQVVALIEKMREREIDAIAFTSKSQFERLQRVAKRTDLAATLDAALAEVIVAAV